LEADCVAEFLSERQTDAFLGVGFFFLQKEK
jgi:hypothetical protein